MDPGRSPGPVSVSFNGLSEIFPTSTRGESEKGQTVDVSYAHA